MKSRIDQDMYYIILYYIILYYIILYYIIFKKKLHGP
jgi:hypothetical protein